MTAGIEETLTAGEVAVEAFYVGEEITLKYKPQGGLAAQPHVLTTGHQQWAVLFKYGVAVTVNMSGFDTAKFLDSLASYTSGSFATPESEKLIVVIDAAHPEQQKEGKLYLQELSIDRMRVVADILAKSVVLAQYEAEVALAFEQIEPLAKKMTEGKVVRSNKELLQFIGRTLLIQQKMVGRAEMTDKPEVLWERPELERLFGLLREEYELLDRHTVLERKLSLIARTADYQNDMLQFTRSHRVEWYIVLLIIFEIVLTLIEKWGT